MVVMIFIAILLTLAAIEIDDKCNHQKMEEARENLMVVSFGIQSSS